VNDWNKRWGIIGHTWAIESLEHAIRTRRNAHAFLITGPHSVGKTTLARALAKRLLCLQNDAPASQTALFGETAQIEPPCNACRACVKTAKGVNPDVMLLEGVPSRDFYNKFGSTAPPRASDREKRAVLVDQMRDMEKWLSTSPFESKFKIGIVRRFEDANEEAQNAFLKTLEEPPAHAVLILTAQDAGLLLPTIVSRCQPLTLRPLAIETVERALVEKWNVSESDAQLLARISGGRLGWAVRALTTPKLLETRREALDALHALVREGRAERITRAEGLAKQSAELPQLFETWQTWWRDVLLLSQNENARVTNVDYAAPLTQHAQQFTIAEIQRALDATRTAARQLGQNANARLVTEVLVLRLPRG
jgi:DNA polymerase-3 subunit delta'